MKFTGSILNSNAGVIEGGSKLSITVQIQVSGLKVVADLIF
jgi:hypothetical protein